MALVFDDRDEYIASLEAELNESLCCGIECNCFEYGNGDIRTTLNCPEHGPTEHLAFEEWEAKLTQDLSYLLDEPATDENLAKIADTIDYYFADTHFQHADHEIIMTRLPDGGIEVVILMNYDDPDDYEIDFGVDFGVDFVLRVDTDGHPLVLSGGLDPFDEATADDFWHVVSEMKKRDAIMAEEIARETDEDRMANHVRMEEWLRDMVAQREMGVVHTRIVSDIKQHAAAMTTGTDSDEREKKVESIEDILFAPIDSGDEKTPQPAVDKYGNCDCC